MDKTVTERRVLRWFYNGKGYGSKLRAYKAMAKDALMTEVFGPIEDVTVVTAADLFTGAESSYTYQTRKGLMTMDEETERWIEPRGFSADPEQQKAYRKGLFAAKMREFGFTCDSVPHPDEWPSYEPIECPATYGFCGRAYKSWIDAKARELMKEADESAKRA
jgi:hypothetical protein